MTPTWPKDGTQEDRVLKVLLEAGGGWVNGRHFLHTMMLSQYHRAIWNLQNRFHWKVEPSTFFDPHGFKSYRIEQGAEQLSLL